MVINEKMILPVFRKLVEYKPKLAMLLPEDDDEEPEFRQLGAEIISSFPWPLGVELRRLFSVGLHEQNRGRLDQILKTVERMVQFLSFILLVQVIEARQTRQLTLPNDLTANFASRFGAPALGTYVWLIQALGSVLEDNQLAPFVPEMEIVFSKKFARKLQPWLPIRNEIAHYLVNLSDADIEARCYEYQETLTDMLLDLCFLSKYPLVTITDIHVNKRKRKPITYDHDITVLNNITSDFSGKRREYSSYSDNRSVLFVKTLKDVPADYLNLSPFIVDTHTEILDTPEKIKNLRKDIFLYSKRDHGVIHYVGTEAREKCDLRSLSYYDVLNEELDEYFAYFGGGTAE